MRRLALLVAIVVPLKAGAAAAQEPVSVVQSTCAALNEEPERLAAFEARALAELALRNPAIARVVVTCRPDTAQVRVEPARGAPRSREVAVTGNRQQLIDDLLAAVWDLAPDPPPPPAAAPAPAPPPRRASGPEKDVFFVLGRFAGEAWLGPVHGLWGADAGAGWQREAWWASATLGVRRPLEVPSGFDLSELGGSMSVHRRLLGPLSLGASLGLWRTAVEADLATPDRQVAWSAKWGLALRANVKLGKLEGSVGPELGLRTPDLELRLDAREIAELPLLSGGVAVELRLGL